MPGTKTRKKVVNNDSRVYMEFRRQILSFRSIFFILLFIILGISLERLFSMTSTEIGFIDNETYAGSFFVIIKFAVISFRIPILIYPLS